MSLLNIHSELFLLNKSLIQVVLIFAVKEIYLKLYELFSNIPHFGTNSSIQAHVDMFCLKETFKIYANDESKETISKIIRLIPTGAFEQNRNHMTKIINDFQHSMQPYIAIFQQQPPQSSVPLIQSAIDGNGDSKAHVQTPTKSAKKSGEIVL